MKLPAYIYDLDLLKQNAAELNAIFKISGCKYLYPLKPCSLQVVLEALLPHIDGFEVSSLFEAQLAREVSPHKPVHFTSPGLTKEELPQVLELCSVISCNSLSQLKWVAQQAPANKLALRINPQLSFIEDERYDPCRISSKLGVPLSQLLTAIEDNPQLPECFDGLTFHSVCEEEGFQPLQQILDKLIPLLSAHADNWQWISFGGGYLFEKENEYHLLHSQVERMHKLGLEVYMEPGSATVAESASLTTEVIDIFESDGQQIAVLNSSVNHLPEAFEYDYQYPLAEAQENAEFQYILAGNTCLAGDTFGTYSFATALVNGQQLNFCDCGAYSLVKAHMFNGHNMPSIYTKNEGLL